MDLCSHPVQITDRRHKRETNKTQRRRVKKRNKQDTKEEGQKHGKTLHSTNLPRIETPTVVA